MLDKFRSTPITWDKATSRIYSPVTANESDENGRKLVVQIVNGGQVEDLTGATLHLYWETRDKAHDGLDVFKAVDLKKGEFELSYTTGMLSNQGVLNANLVLIDTVGRVVSERFKITVTEGIDNDAIQSENSFSSLTQALIDISNLEQNYAPRLNDLTAQLQHKTTKGDIGLSDLNKNKTQFDETWMTDEFKQQIAGSTPISATISAESVTTDKLADKSVEGYKTDFLTMSENRYDFKDYIPNGYYNGVGTWVESTGFNSTGFIVVNGGVTYATNLGQLGGIYGNVAFWDKDKKFISGFNAGTWTATITTPANARYVTLPYNNTKDMSTGMFVEGASIPTGFIPFQYTLKPFVKVSSESLDSATKVKTNGKRLLLFGDSITETSIVSDDGATYTPDTVTNWPTYAKTILQVSEMWNYAKSGASLRDKQVGSLREYVGHQIQTAIDNNRPGDIIVVSAGTNDGDGSMMLGSYETAMSKATLNDLQTGYTYEALRWAFWTIRQNYPSAMCFVATPIQRATIEPPVPIIEAINKMARRYNFIVIDAANESGIVREFENNNSTGRWLRDGLHPTEEGKKLMANLYSRVILNAHNY